MECKVVTVGMLSSPSLLEVRVRSSAALRALGVASLAQSFLFPVLESAQRTKQNKRWVSVRKH